MPLVRFIFIALAILCYHTVPKGQEYVEKISFLFNSIPVSTRQNIVKRMGIILYLFKSIIKVYFFNDLSIFSVVLTLI